MTPLKQLVRQPIRLAAILLLFSLTSAFFSLGVGVLLSASATLSEIEREYVTIGVPTTETEDRTIELNGLNLHYQGSVIIPEMWDYLDSLAENGSLVKAAYRQKFISAYSPVLQTVTSGKEDGAYRSHLDAPYNRAIFAVRIMQVNPSAAVAITEQISVRLTAKIEQVIALHPDYSTRDTLYINLTCSSQEAYDALGIAPGKRFMIYGSSYQDEDLALRTDLAESYRCSPEDIDLSKLSYDLSGEDIQGMVSQSPNFHPVAVYRYGDRATLMEKTMAQKKDACSLSVSSAELYSDMKAVAIDGNELNERWADRCCAAYITPLHTDVNTFLASEEAADWREAIEELTAQYHTVSVFGTDLLESMYSFHQKQAFVTQGRSFTDEEYQNGADICLISESTAAASHLSLGDELDLSFYWGANPRNDVNDLTWALGPCPYSQKVGMLEGSRSYRIVGIYRQSNLWDTANYRFLPNTVFVPNASLKEPCYTSRDGVFFTFVLQNGKIQALQDALSAKGYPADLLFYFDKGYSEIADTLQGFYRSAVQLFIVACAVCLAALPVYLVLFVFRQRRIVGLMLSLGAGQACAKRFARGVTILPLPFASVIGAVAGVLLMNATMQKLFSSAAELLDTSLSGASSYGHALTEQILVSYPLLAALAALVQAVLYVGVIVFCVDRLVCKSPLALLRKG